jgi:hypothetical protein
MSARFPKGRVASVTGVSAKTALRLPADKAATAMRQAFAAALGARPQPGHPGDLLRKDAAGTRPPGAEPLALRMKNRARAPSGAAQGTSLNRILED